MAMAYARYTKVPVDRSRAEIERLLSHYKADQFGTAIDNDKGRAMVQFRLQKRLIRFDLPFPNKNEQEVRRRWRALVLSIKAKLEAVESGITSFESEFLGYVVLPDGRTVGETIRPELDRLIQSNQMPQSLLPDYSAKGHGTLAE